MVDHTVARVMDLLGVANDLAPRWGGMREIVSKDDAR